MRWRTFVGALAAALVALAQAGAAASAAAWPPPLLTQFPEQIATASGADRLNFPRGMAVEQASGNILVTESNNNRISEFTPWGVFIRAWGWGVLDGSPEAQVCTAATGCQAGIAGSGPGQMLNPAGIAVGDDGSVYVVERENARLQKFDPDGGFALMVGGEVNKTSGENLCTAASGDECGVGVTGTGDGQFASQTGASGHQVAIAPDGAVYVGDRERVQSFSPAGQYLGEIVLSDISGLPADYSTATARVLTFNPAGELYIAFAEGTDISPQKRDVFKLNPATKAVLQVVEVRYPKAMAVGADGSLYVANATGPKDEEILKFGPGGDQIGDPCCEEPLIPITAIATSSACNLAEEDLFVAHFVSGPPRNYVRGYGPPPDPAVCPPPPNPPAIADQYATGVGTESAKLWAAINPRFWPDATYQLEWGAGKCSEGGCPNLAPASPVDLGSGVNQALRTAPVPLAGLEPASTYHYRFIAQSAGGGPVRGLGGTPGADGAEGSFTTMPPAQAPSAACANQPFRSGASAALAECRAYEMVSPVDKNNGDVYVMGNINGRPASLNQAAAGGEALTFSSYRAFADPQSAPYTNQYLARRVAGTGWSTRSISPPRNASLLEKGETFDSQYKYFEPGLCRGWLRYESTPPLDAATPPGYPSLYSRDLCGPGAYAGLLDAFPSNLEPIRFVPEVQGVAAGGQAVAFRSAGKLTASAPDLGETERLLYLAGAGLPLRFACVLPDGSAHQGSCSAGSPTTLQDHRSYNVAGALSEDGRRLYWSAKTGVTDTLYLRVNPEAEQSAVSAGECTEAAKACTLAVSTLVSGGDSFFWSAAADGSSAYFSLGSSLYRYELASESAEPLAGGVAGMLGASADGERAYLVSSEALDAEAQAGQPNLYLYEAGPEEFTFVATVSSLDATPNSGNEQPTMVNHEPFKRSAQVSADGGVAVFMSTAPLSGVDNTDAVSGKALAQVFRYEAATGELACVSCNRTGARPAGENIAGETNQLWAAAQIPRWESFLYAPRVLSGDGSRVFFESFEALLSADTNGKQDVYEWRREGSGECSASSGRYFPASGGCLALISSGKSPAPSDLIDSAADGRDVFFATQESLLAQDPGALDVYDARVGGGLPAPPAPPGGCVGAACQGPPPAPVDPAPASSTYNGPGNQIQRPAAKRCPKGKRKLRRAGKVRCVAPARKKAAKAKKNRARRAAAKARGAGR